MKYFYDTEFLEGTQKSFFGQSKPTIDLISIGIVAEDGREYYAISKDFNLKEAWNRYDLKEQTPYEKSHGFSGRKIYWIREYVLRPIFNELLSRFNNDSKASLQTRNYIGHIINQKFSLKLLKFLVKYYGKTNKQIAIEVQEFVYQFAVKGYPKENTEKIATKDIQLYGYYSAYDHVVLCWLFGKMIDLPKGFPMYTIDLKQSMDDFVNNELLPFENSNGLRGDYKFDFEGGLKLLKTSGYYPKQTNEHNALADAKWNLKLYNFLEGKYETN